MYMMCLNNALQVVQTPSAGTTAPTYSNAAVVPAITSVAVFSNYATVASFNSTVQAQVWFACTLDTCREVKQCVAVCHAAQMLELEC